MSSQTSKLDSDNILVVRLAELTEIYDNLLLKFPAPNHARTLESPRFYREQLDDQYIGISNILMRLQCINSILERQLEFFKKTSKTQ